MIQLRSVPFEAVQHWFQDFQRKSKCYEMPPDRADYVGIFHQDELIGYFCVVSYVDEWIEINQGYLKPAYRHHDLPKECFRLLEDGCRKAGYKEIRLGTHSRFCSYIKFMKQNGYKPEHLIFSKRI